MLSHWRRLADGRLVNVTKSIEHPLSPVREADGIVRMEAGIAGQVFSLVEGGPEALTHLVQIADGDLKGWIPQSVISFRKSCHPWRVLHSQFRACM